MAKKQKQTKGAKKSSKATKAHTPDAAVPATRPESPKGRMPKSEPKPRARDPRLPPAGTVLKRTFKGAEIKVTVLDAGFRYEGKEYKSLTATALAITGYPAISGPAFFKLTGAKGAEPKPAVGKAQKGKRAAKKQGADAAPVAEPEVAPVTEAATA